MPRVLPFPFLSIRINVKYFRFRKDGIGMDGFLDGFGINLLVAIVAQILVAIGLFVFRFAIRKANELTKLPFTAKDRLFFLAWMMLTAITYSLFMIFWLFGRFLFSILAFIAWTFFYDKTMEIFYKYYYAALKSFEDEKPEKPRSDKENNVNSDT